MPEKNDVKRIRTARINCYRPLGNPKHSLTLALLPDLRLSVEATAYAWTVDKIENFEQAKQGELYRFVANHTDLFYLPQKIVTAMREYDWEQHRAQMEEWFTEREKRVMEMVQEGGIRRPNYQ